MPLISDAFARTKYNERAAAHGAGPPAEGRAKFLEVAVLVALIQLGGLLEIRPGPAAVAFGVMVVVTMFAAESFDPRLIWDQEGPGDG